MHPSSPISSSVVVLVAVLALVLPVIARFVSSPFTVLLLSPLLLFLLAVAFAVAFVALGHFLDSKQANQQNDLRSAARPLGFSTPAAWQAVVTRSRWSQNESCTLSPVYPESQAVSAVLEDLMTLVVRDFVLTWYSELSTSPSFPSVITKVLHDSLESLIARAFAIDVPALLVKRILPEVTQHIERFRQSEIELRGAALERRLTQSEELDLLLASRYSSKGGTKLHSAIDNLSTTFTKQTEEAHLKHLIEKALPFILPENEGNSRIFKLVVREIVACAVLYPMMDMMADPDFWNRAIDELAGAAIHQQRLVSKVRNVLEAQSPRSQARLSTPTETITISTGARQFESFLRSISRSSSLLDIRRLKNDIVGEIRRTRMLLADHEKDDWINGEKTEDVVAFLDRLYTAKRKAEQRIVLLGGAENTESSHEPSTEPRLTLRDVLGNPSSLSYFMEFMDRRNRSLLVQFWLTVESFKNPLEAVDTDSSGDEDDAIQEVSYGATVKEDISMIHDLYFSGATPHQALACISKKHFDIIRSFAKDELTPLPATERRVRHSVLLAQRQVEKEMEQDFEDFERSELWFRVIGDAESRQHKAAAERPNARNQSQASSSSDSSMAVPSVPPPARIQSPYFLPRSESAPGFGLARGTVTSANFSTGQISLGHPNQPASPPPALRPSPSNMELLMSPPVESTRAPLFDGPEDKVSAIDDAQMQRMEAIRAALTDIIALDKKGTGSSTTGLDTYSSEEQDPLFTRSAATAGSRRRPVFDDDNDVDEANEDHPEEANGGSGRSFQLAAPGDLQLSYEISRLEEKITSLQAQDSMLDTLIKKAELAGDTQELRLLMKSKSSMSRDLRELRFQKLQYEQQESANRLISDRTTITIASSAVGEEEGKSVVRYLIEVQQHGPDGGFASGWVVARRYNEFLKMHNRLKERYSVVKNLDFPGKRLMTSLSGSFLDTRRTGLEKYLQSLVAIPVVCDSSDLRSFLSRDSPFVASDPSSASKSSPSFSAGKDLVRTVYRSVAQSVDDIFFGPSMLDVMILRLTRQAAEFVGIVGSGVNDEDLVARALKASGKSTSEDTLMQLPGDLKPLEGETSTSTFSAPICDLALAVFELNKQNNWLRRQAIVIILQQVLGGTIERKIRDFSKTLVEESRLMSMMGLFRENLWPSGRLKTRSFVRTPEEKLRTRDDANRKLSSLLPDLAANVIGRSNARRGARRIFAVLQNRRLNQHIAYVILDEIFNALFPGSSPSNDMPFVRHIS